MFIILAGRCGDKFWPEIQFVCLLFMVDDFNDFVVVDVSVSRCMSCGLEWGWK